MPAGQPLLDNNPASLGSEDEEGPAIGLCSAQIRLRDNQVGDERRILPPVTSRGLDQRSVWLMAVPPAVHHAVAELDQPLRFLEHLMEPLNVTGRQGGGMSKNEPSLVLDIQLARPLEALRSERVDSHREPHLQTGGRLDRPSDGVVDGVDAGIVHAKVLA